MCRQTYIQSVFQAFDRNFDGVFVVQTFLQAKGLSITCFTGMRAYSTDFAWQWNLNIIKRQ